MIAWLVGKWVATTAVRGSVGRFLRGLPRGVWYALALAGALVFAVRWYHGQIAAAEKRGEDRAYAAVERKARQIVPKAESVTGKISTAMRDRNDEEARNIGRVADTVRVRGPGAAVCRGPEPAAATGGREPPRGAADGAVDRLPYPAVSELIAMPFDELIDRAEACDLNRAEVLTWREWYRQQMEAWKALQQEAARPTDPG
jgi:hypothetical protein